eukprot:scaffold781_cov132-Cylindrotheca_fusiformis.AAC.27
MYRTGARVDDSFVAESSGRMGRKLDFLGDITLVAISFSCPHHGGNVPCASTERESPLESNATTLDMSEERNLLNLEDEKADSSLSKAGKTSFAKSRPWKRCILYVLIIGCLVLWNLKYILNQTSELSGSLSQAEIESLENNGFNRSAYKKFVAERLKLSISKSKRKKPPKTPGAIIHVGKSGGSTLASVLRNGCHSFMKKPCKKIANESIVSKVTTYYHTPDCKILGKKGYKFYIWVVRDPFARTVSAFRYGHPANIEKRDEKYQKNIAPRAKRIYSRCFPSLNAFAQSLKVKLNETSEIERLKNRTKTQCEGIANAMLQHRNRLSTHLYFDIRMFYKQTRHSRPVFSVRTEFLWEDWVRVNELLGQGPGTVRVNEEKVRRDSSALKLPISAEIGDVEREYLCHAIAPEYEVYFEILSKSINIQEEDFVEMVQLAKKNCPNLNNSVFTIDY